VRRWPLFLIASPAAVSIWSGWVGLGELCGFGVVHPLPGIVPGFALNTAITLPVGVEAYGAYALGAWLSLQTDHPARTFARRSAIGALALGMLGQVVYHLLAAAHAVRSPWPVVVLVSCLPVVTLGFGAALTHLLRAPGDTPETAPEAHPEPAPEAVAAAAAARTRTAPERPTRSAPRHRTRTEPVIDTDVELRYAAELTSGALPSMRQIRSDLHVGQDRAQRIRAHLEALTPAP
jgi:hypothetical protein